MANFGSPLNPAPYAPPKALNSSTHSMAGACANASNFEWQGSANSIHAEAYGPRADLWQADRSLVKAKTSRIERISTSPQIKPLQAHDGLYTNPWQANKPIINTNRVRTFPLASQHHLHCCAVP
eukprot:scaffold220613_cov21-Tisochrysis_lutea.AAC.2